MRSFHDYNIAKLQDTQDAALYLTESLIEFKEDNNIDSFLKALKDVTEAQGGIGVLSKKTSLNRQNLYRVLSAERQPKVETLGAILDGLGLQLTIIPKKADLENDSHKSN